MNLSATRLAVEWILGGGVGDRSSQGRRGNHLPPVPAVLVLLLACWTPASQAADFFNGQKLYQRYCIDCHGPAGRGVLPGTPDFSRGEGLFQTDAQIMRHIRQGSARAPGFGNSLSEREMLDIIAYLRGFR